MLPSLRTALLVFAALSASSVAPAQVGPASEPMIPDSSGALPQAAVVQPLVPETLPYQLPAPTDAVTAPVAETAQPDELAPVPARPSFDRGGDLASLVAQFRSSDPGSRELECLAVGIYFESKSEPLAG